MKSASPSVRSPWAARILYTALPSVFAILAADVAAAQEAEQRAQGAIEEVIVTAQKRAENVQTVPIAMQAFSSEQLQNQHINKITDIARLAPNLNVVVQNALSQHIVIRGVGTNEFFGNAPSSVGTYMDEVTMNSSYMSTLGLFDMERVEVLRGPQNSLFGRNTTGGAVNYITKTPTVGGDGADGDFLLTYGDENLVEAEGGISLPLGSTAALRVAGLYRQRDGIWHNVDTGDDNFGDQDHYSLRATLVLEPSEATRFTASVHSARADDEAQPQKMTGAFANNPPLRMNDLVPFAGNIDWASGNLNTVGNVPAVNVQGFDRLTTKWQDVWNGGSQRAELRVDGGYLKLVHDFGGASLTAIASYDKTHGFYEEDNTGNGNIAGAGTPGVTNDVLVIDMDQFYEQYTGELRLASNDDDARLRWITGIYFLNEDSLLAQDIRFGNNGFPGAHPSANGITPPSLFDVIPNPYGDTVSFSIADLKDQSASIYGQTDFRFADKWSFTLGVRYTKDKKENPSYYAGAFLKPTPWDPSIYIGEDQIRQLAAGLPTCVPKTDPGYIPFQRCANTNTSREDLDTDEVGGKIGLQFFTSEDAMFYGSYSRGFKSGKYDVEFLHTDDTPFPQRPLEVETLDVFELGFKSTLLDRSLMFNAAVFYNIWKDQQVFNVGVNGPEFFNLPESKIKGAEVETSWVPAESWLLSASIGLLDTEITDATGINFDLGQGDFQEGHELPLSPEMTANAAISKSIAIGVNELSLQADWRYQSSSKVKFSPQVPIDEYTSRSEVNARVGFAFGEAHQYELGLYGRNLTDEQYCVEIQDLRGVSGSLYCVPNEGEARYGLQARVSF